MGGGVNGNGNDTVGRRAEFGPGPLMLLTVARVYWFTLVHWVDLYLTWITWSWKTGGRVKWIQTVPGV